MSPLWLAALSGCGWNHLPDGDEDYLDALWNPAEVVAANDGLYVPLQRNGGLVRLSSGERSVIPVDIGEGRVVRVEPTPDRDGVIALIERYTCADPDVRRGDDVRDCAEEDLIRRSELTAVRDGAAERVTGLDGSYNTVRVSPDGAFAVAWFDLGGVDEIQDVVSLTSVVVLDRVAGTNTLVSVGFPPSQIVFGQDSTGATNRVVVSSHDTVALVTLDDGAPRRTVTYPLTIDGYPIQVRELVLGPDQTQAVLRAGSTDVYLLDLVDPSINLLQLPEIPDDVAVSPAGNATLFVSASGLHVLDHDTLDIDTALSWTFSLDDPRIVPAGEEFLITVRDQVFRYDVLTGRVETYDLQGDGEALSLSPDGGFAVVTTTANARTPFPGVEILDLATDDSTPFVLEGRLVDVTFDDEGRVLLLQEDEEYIFRYHMVDRTSDRVQLSVLPVSLGGVPGGVPYAAQDEGFGLVTFLTEPDLREVGGFALTGLEDAIEIVGEDQ